jgi:hypothetical protein
MPVRTPEPSRNVLNARTRRRWKQAMLHRIAVAALLLAWSAGARALGPPQPAPLQTLPAAPLEALAPVLRDRDLALIEVKPDGALKQATTVTLVAAPAATVREVVIHPEHYPDFVRNMSKKSKVVTEPAGTLWHEYFINYRVHTVDGRHRYVFLDKAPDEAVAPVDMYDPDPGGDRHYRWEFLPVGDATLLVLYGYNKIPHDGFTSRYLNRAPTLDYGFTLIPQMTLLLSMKARAEQLSGGKVTLPSGKPGTYDFLLERGALATFASVNGHLKEVSVVERTTAPAAEVLKVAADPARWSSFVPTVEHSSSLGMQGGFAGVQIDQKLPLMSWSTTWAVRVEHAAVDLFGVGGDLRGGQLRWDVRQRDDGHAEVVLRAMTDFQKGSLLLRQVYKLEPYLEYGFDLALNLLLVQSVRHRAEQVSVGRQ